jgi:methylmalonyl-CoA mutase
MSPLSSPPKDSSARSKLLSEFSETSVADWRKIVEADLKGVPFEKKLVSKTFEGLNLQPLYTEADLNHVPHLGSLPGFPPYVRGRTASGYLNNGWDVSQEIAVSSPTEFNEAARNSVDKGLTALNIVLDKATRDGHDPDWAEAGEVGVGGLSIATLEDLDRALAGIDLEKISLFVRSGSSAMPFAALLMALVRKRGQSPRKLRGCIEMDPLGVLSHEGKLPLSLKGAFREMAELTSWCAENAPQLQTICVHARAWHESGGSAVEELGFALATSVDYLRELNGKKLTIDSTAPRHRFAFTVGSNFFMEIAKLRAARLLWSQAIQSLGGNDESQKLNLHVRTSNWNKTKYDPHVNMLRSTVEAFAAVLGGCDSLQVGAFDETFRTPNDFSLRIARNTQLILQKECDLTHIIDPAGGTWYLEKLTDDLAKKAWALFQDVERRGGMAEALRTGFPQSVIAGVQAEKKKALASRKSVLIGTTKYANVTEKPLAPTQFDAAAFRKKRRQQVISYRTQSEDAKNTMVLQKLSNIIDTHGDNLFEACVNAVQIGGTLGEVTRAIRISEEPDTTIKPLKIERWAKEFEIVRDAVEAATLKTGVRPSVYLLNMGPLPQHKARAEFSKSFFEVAGLNVHSPQGFDSVEKAAQAAADSDAGIAVICSTDETYPHLVPTLVPALKRLNPDLTIVLAGHPTDHVDFFKELGVDEFIHIRSNILQTLETILKKRGILS